MSTSSSSSDAMALRAAAVAFKFESCSGQPGSQQLLSDVQPQQSVPEARRMISQQPKAAVIAFVRHCRFRNPANNAVQIQVRAARLLPGLFSRSCRLPSVLLGALRALHTSSGGRKHPFKCAGFSSSRGTAFARQGAHSQLLLSLCNLDCCGSVSLGHDSRQPPSRSRAGATHPLVSRYQTSGTPVGCPFGFPVGFQRPV